jgi:hypothetical protein
MKACSHYCFLLEVTNCTLMYSKLSKNKFHVAAWLLLLLFVVLRPSRTSRTSAPVPTHQQTTRMLTPQEGGRERERERERTTRAGGPERGRATNKRIGMRQDPKAKFLSSLLSPLSLLPSAHLSPSYSSPDLRHIKVRRGNQISGCHPDIMCSTPTCVCTSKCMRTQEKIGEVFDIFVTQTHIHTRTKVEEGSRTRMHT